MLKDGLFIPLRHWWHQDKFVAKQPGTGTAAEKAPCSVLLADQKAADEVAVRGCKPHQKDVNCKPVGERAALVKGHQREKRSGESLQRNWMCQAAMLYPGRSSSLLRFLDHFVAAGLRKPVGSRGDS